MEKKKKSLPYSLSKLLLGVLLIVFVGAGLAACGSGEPEVVTPKITVVDALTELPLANAQIALVAPDRDPIVAVTDENGVAILEIPASYDGTTAELAVVYPGFRGVLVEVPLLPGPDDELRFELQPAFE